MAGRPRHEALRGQVTELLREAFGAGYDEIGHEVHLRDGTGRIDTMWGTTVIEFKTDLRRESGDVHARLPAYLIDAQSRSADPVTGIATDGATFVAYALREGALVELARYATDAERPTELLAWLEPLLSARLDLPPEPRAVALAFGRTSPTFGAARLTLDALWATLGTDPEVRLKRDLWDGLLREAYGESVGQDSLFLQHTYLAIVVKAIAARVLDLPVDDAAALLSGKALVDAGIVGAVEADFFDWPLRLPDGVNLVRRIAAQAARFRLRDVKVDVLKILYESLVDPDQRHDLGEYYTPDWLAGRVVAEAVDRPLTQRVLDPACGSGTFLFHAIRRLIEAGRDAGWANARILATCAENVRGLDVHPVAVTLARVTWLLALGDIIGDRAATLTVPVFLGDAMQWNVRSFAGGVDVLVDVPGDRPLQIPAGFAENQVAFEQGLDTLNQGLSHGSTPEAVGRALARIEHASEADVAALAGTFGQLQALYRAGRNGIWTFVLRNLVRPVWLSRADQRADVLVGNPPWIVYRHLSPEMKERVRDALRVYGLWVGGNLATQQDIFALFWARGAERYLRQGGRIGFVLPYAVLNAPVFAALRAGFLGPISVRITAGWALERVWPIFGAQSGSSTTSTCVLFGAREAPGPIPAKILRSVGHLPRRDADEVQAKRALTRTREAWPRARTLIGASPYRDRFQQGATIVPRRFFLVDPEPTSRLGPRKDAPMMRGRAGALDKHPWTTVEPPRGPVEREFLRPLLLGEHVLPFRLLDPVTAVVPLMNGSVLNAHNARDAGFNHLADWMSDIEAKWAQESNKKLDGSSQSTLIQRLDHMRKLTSQTHVSDLRVLYSASGTRLSAALINNTVAIVEHGAYWSDIKQINEGRYLLSIINSHTILSLITDLQPHGQRDKRHFDNLVWTLPIPEYDDADILHRDLAAAAMHAETVAATVTLTDAQHFTAKRRVIRAALAEDGIAAEIEALVAALLPL